MKIIFTVSIGQCLSSGTDFHTLKISLTIIKSTSVCLAVASNHRKFADGLVRCYLSRCSRVSGDCMWLGWEQWSIKAGRVMAQRKALDQAIVPLSLLFLQRQSKLSRSVDFQRYYKFSFVHQSLFHHEVLCCYPSHRLLGPICGCFRSCF